MKYAVKDIEKRIKRFKTKNLMNRPTPVSRLNNLSEHFKGPDIFIKRDDLTGLAFGGNKSRKLEYILQDVIDKGSDVVITWGSIQSNWCLQTAAAARKFGIIPILILFDSYDAPKMDGNLLLDLILDADIRIKEAEKGKVVKAEDVKPFLEEVQNEVLEWGHQPYIIPIGGSMIGGSMKEPLGAVAYVDAYLELKRQMDSLGKELDYIVLASGSGGTQAGLLIGSKICGDKTKVLGISVSDDRKSFSLEIKEISEKTLNCLDLNTEIDDDIIVLDDYIGEGYGALDENVTQAIRSIAFYEGIFVDPIYTGKAVYALSDLIQKGYFTKDHCVLFLHTGGTPALFPYKEKFRNFLSKK